MAVHEIAQTGFGKGTNDLYDRQVLGLLRLVRNGSDKNPRARPSYQASAISYIRNIVRGNDPLNIAEIGAGTGIFTRALLAHPEWSSNIKELKAIEPSVGMREVFANTIKDERVTVQDGTFDTTYLPDGWADLIVVAQAFHWCPDYDKACTEFARILKPDGCAVFIWNLEDRDRARWVAQLRSRIEQHEKGTPQFRLMLWRQAFETQSYQKFFEKPLEKIYTFDLPTTADITLDRAFSKSYIAVLNDTEKVSVKNDLDDILERGEERRWIDKEQGIFEYPYQCFVVVAQKK